LFANVNQPISEEIPAGESGGSGSGDRAEKPQIHLACPIDPDWLIDRATERNSIDARAYCPVETSSINHV
jgi:hypothetical protein